ncbi:MAG: uracil phosphoribosyltransferase [Actinobacteria bacterium HGW-Actinobacteria-6]|nr:MAG: uracil phosphoribosyltransferase [Actinobacteria bacterium HGW-Actinobacteria-6]
MSDRQWENVVVMDHPLIQHKLSILRDVKTGAKEFRELVKELAMLMAYEATRGFQLAETTVTTPVAETTTYVLAGKKVAVIPILRAGLGMVDGILELLPAAKVGHIGLYRDPETLQPVEYYCKLPEDIGERDILIVDPMLATGGSAAAAVEFLRERGAREINLLCIISAPEGIQAVVDSCKDVCIYTCAVDSHLNDHGYIVPGLGDAGDRLFGTK